MYLIKAARFSNFKYAYGQFKLMTHTVEISDVCYKSIERLAKSELRTVPEVVEKALNKAVIRAFE